MLQKAEIEKLKNCDLHFLYFITQKVSTWRITKWRKCSLLVLQKAKMENYDKLRTPLSAFHDTEREPLAHYKMRKVLTFRVTKGRNWKIMQISIFTFWHRKWALGTLQNEESAQFPCYKRQKLKNQTNYELHFLHFRTQKGTWRITNGESVHIPHFITRKVFSAAKSGGGGF